jgi:serine/threonine-protein kinase
MYRERFDREAQNAATLSHPNIVGVYDRGEYEGQLWITMAYVDGIDASRLLDEKYRTGMPPAEVVQIISEVAGALDYAHQRQLLHRDVKPANILLAELDSGGWRAMLADFGIARRVDDSSTLTQTNMTVGTVAYAAPEQLMGQPLDGRADQYSLAATAFELFTGSHLYLDGNPAVVISQHVSAPPPAIEDRKPELSGLGPVLSKALAKSPRERYDTCVDFADALSGNDATMAAAVYARRHRNKPKNRKRLLVTISAIVAVLLIAAAAAAVILTGRQQKSAAPQQRPAVPVVLVGADCAVLGAAGITETGQQAYCARLPSTGDIMWSLVSGVVPTPTVTPGATDPVYPAGIEQQVDVCIQQTGQTRAECREDIRRGNLSGPA